MQPWYRSKLLCRMQLSQIVSSRSRSSLFFAILGPTPHTAVSKSRIINIGSSLESQDGFTSDRLRDYKFQYLSLAVEICAASLTAFPAQFWLTGDSSCEAMPFYYRKSLRLRLVKVTGRFFSLWASRSPAGLVIESFHRDSSQGAARELLCTQKREENLVSSGFGWIFIT